MKNKDTRLFEFLNWVLKNNNDRPHEYEPPLFLVNRWISMINPQFCLILNSTANRWGKVFKQFDFGSFYHRVLPKYNNKINYIKKKSKISEDNIEDIKNIADRLECSAREVELFETTLAQLNTSSN